MKKTLNRKRTKIVVNLVNYLMLILTFLYTFNTPISSATILYGVFFVTSFICTFLSTLEILQFNNTKFKRAIEFLYKYNYVSYSVPTSIFLLISSFIGFSLNRGVPVFQQELLCTIYVIILTLSIVDYKKIITFYIITFCVHFAIFLFDTSLFNEIMRLYRVNYDPIYQVISRNPLPAFSTFMIFTLFIFLRIIITYDIDKKNYYNFQINDVYLNTTAKHYKIKVVFNIINYVVLLITFYQTITKPVSQVKILYFMFFVISFICVFLSTIELLLMKNSKHELAVYFINKYSYILYSVPTSIFLLISTYINYSVNRRHAFLVSILCAIYIIILTISITDYKKLFIYYTATFCVHFIIFWFDIKLLPEIMQLYRVEYDPELYEGVWRDPLSAFTMFAVFSVFMVIRILITSAINKKNIKTRNDTLGSSQKSFIQNV
jgi:hypothetical protein